MTAVAPVLATAGPVPPLAPSVVLRGLVAPRLRALYEMGGWLPVIVAVVIGWWSLKYLAAPAWLLAVGVGSYYTWRRVNQGAPAAGYLNARRTFALTGLAAILPPMLLLLQLPRLATLLGLLFVEAFLHRGVATAAGMQWWSHGTLAEALLTAGIVKTRPSLRYLEPVRHDEHGTAVVVQLPATTTWKAVQQAHERMAAALDVAARRLEVSHDLDQPPNVVRLYVGTGTRQTRLADVATAERTHWRDGVVLGLDGRGRPVVFQTSPVVHTLICGRSGSGKTVAGRSVVATAVMDPACQLYGVSGKQEASDWDAVEPLAVNFITRVDAHLAPRVQQLLEDVLTLCRERAAASRGRTTRPDPVLVVIDEWAAVRSVIAGTAGAKALEQVDASMALLLATARSADVAVLLITQKPTGESFPTLQRSNVVQRVVLQTMTASDAAIGLGVDKAPPNLPRKVGEALLTNDTNDARPFHVDHLDDQAWEDVCRRAAKLRAVTATAELVQQPAADPLEVEVLRMLADGPMTPTALFRSLPEALTGGSQQALGRRLAKVSGIESGWVENRRVWRLSTVGEASAERRSDAFPTSSTLVRSLP